MRYSTAGLEQASCDAIFHDFIDQAVRKQIYSQIVRAKIQNVVTLPSRNPDHRTFFVYFRICLFIRDTSAFYFCPLPGTEHRLCYKVDSGVEARSPHCSPFLTRSDTSSAMTWIDPAAEGRRIEEEDL